MAIPKLIYYSDNSYVTSEGTLLEGFDTTSDWIVGTGSRDGNATQRKQGIQSIKLNGTNGDMAWTRKFVSLDLSSVGNFIIWLYVHDDPPVTYLNKIRLVFSSTTDYSKYFAKDLWAGPLWLGDLKKGWNEIAIDKDDFENVGSESWANTMIRIRIEVHPQSGQDASVSFDNLRYDYAGVAKCIITFDDGLDGVINKAKTRMDTNGQDGVCYIVSDWVGTGGYMTKANLETLRDAGWDISNHTKNHPDLTGLSQVNMETSIDEGYAWLVQNGFSDSAKFFAYPGGKFNDAIINKVKERHGLSRSVLDGTHQPHINLLDDDIDHLIKAIYIYNNTTVQTIKDRIDQAIVQKGLIVLLFHNIVDAGATLYQYLTADFNEISDYLKTKEDASLINVITFSDYYDQFMPATLTSVVYLQHAAIVPYPIDYDPSQSTGRAEDGRMKTYKHSMAGDRKRMWRIRLLIDNSGNSGYKWRDLEYFYVKVVEGALRRCVYVDANSVQHLVRITGFAPQVAAAKNKHDVTLILEEDYN